MSNLVVSNISDGTTTVGTEYVVNGSAKAWVNFTGTGTVAIDDSLNTSSITDNSTGRYEANPTNNFANANYCLTHDGLINGGNGWFISYFDKTSANVELLYINTLGSYEDCADASVVYFGELA
jgi:hypothetical protein